MDINAQLYYKSARTLKLPVNPIDDISGFEVKFGQQRYFFRGGNTPFNTESSRGIADNKYCTNKLLEVAGFPIPKFDAIHKDLFKAEKIESLVEHLKFPLVVKPMIGTMAGNGVLCNIKNMTQLKASMKKGYQHHDFLSVEEFHGGLSSYRVLIFYNKVIAILQRFPAHVVGDGIHSIKELITNENSVRQEMRESPTFGFINMNEVEISIRLKELDMTLDSIPKDEERITLCYTCNSGRGGTVKSLGTMICKENSKLLCRAAKVLGLNLVGFDVQCEDILIPFERSGGVIIEANSNPDVSIHEYPTTGVKNQVSAKIIKRLLLKHPIAYLYSLSQRKYNHLYVKSSLAFFILLAYKLIPM